MTAVPFRSDSRGSRKRPEFPMTVQNDFSDYSRTEECIDLTTVEQRNV
jgi:hypothetical protein